MQLCRMNVLHVLARVHTAQSVLSYVLIPSQIRAVINLRRSGTDCTACVLTAATLQDVDNLRRSGSDCVACVLIAAASQVVDNLRRSGTNFTYLLSRTHGADLTGLCVEAASGDPKFRCKITFAEMARGAHRLTLFLDGTEVSFLSPCMRFDLLFTVRFRVL